MAGAGNTRPGGQHRKDTTMIEAILEFLGTVILCALMLYAVVVGIIASLTLQDFLRK